MNNINEFESELKKIYGEYLVSDDVFLVNKMMNKYYSFDFDNYDITFKILVLNILNNYIKKILF